METPFSILVINAEGSAANLELPTSAIIMSCSFWTLFSPIESRQLAFPSRGEHSSKPCQIPGWIMVIYIHTVDDGVSNGFSEDQPECFKVIVTSHSNHHLQCLLATIAKAKYTGVGSLRDVEPAEHKTFAKQTFSCFVCSSMKLPQPKWCAVILNHEKKLIVSI